MSDFVIHKGQRPAGGFARHYGAATEQVTFSPSKPTKVMLADGREGQGSCLGCGNAPCMEKHPSELALAGELEAYPGDPSLDVCPTQVITWDAASSAATVDANACIGCGLCVARCPYGAISLQAGRTAAIATGDPDGLVVAKGGQAEHPKPTRTGTLAKLNAPAAAAIPETVGSLPDAKSVLLVRNLLHEIGMNARVRRRGDTNMRIDAVGYARSNRPFVAEIELSNAVIENPRALLEDVAILHARYGYVVADIDPVSIILSLPNLRSEYYQVIRDIENVLGVRCRTVTVGAMVALLWTCSRLDGFEGDAFIIGAGGADLAANLGMHEGVLHEPYPGAFRPAK
ncbi:4Fe-4S dicluster domain-containing protein [Paracraurococcus ruber]|uniref:4Fe-4S ferredoxin-type domain-containing protein n=1 Tax=Paracraurococcus ruber TaxID=77675 RepID=A0ABS1CZI3_9PROT|nr:4Fe-4S dicluster domain-containing protein [Paracraurococcus ruber]MBK1659859.1 hypothetical protein [Paracraurococcus ruber]TDG28960.1 4Fe-4S dicluster domain-containing protein [Paracraurococcus ruber]